MGEDIMLDTSTQLSRDVFKPISWDNTYTDSFTTMDMVVSHPRVSEQVSNNLINGYVEDIGIGDVGKYNNTYLSLYDGIDENPYEDGDWFDDVTVVMGKNVDPYRDLDNLTKMGGLELYELLDEMTNVGIDIT
jgi:hypothetical protein